MGRDTPICFDSPEREGPPRLSPATGLKVIARNIVVLRGGMSAKDRTAAKAALTVADDEERLILATGRYIGEGFDDARLDTLFLTMPIAWKGTLAQYVGRLHRRHNDKKDVLVGRLCR